MMLLGARQLFEGGGDTPYFDVNPAKSNGTAWFNTGYVATDNTRLEMCVQFDDRMVSYLSCGRRERWPPSKAYQIHVNGMHRHSAYIAWNSSSAEVYNLTPATFGVFSIYKGQLFLNGEVVKTYSGTLQASSLPIWLCNINQNGSPADGGLYGVFFWAKIYDNETLVRHYIPQPDITLKDVVGGGTIQKSGQETIIYGEM